MLQPKPPSLEDFGLTQAAIDRLKSFGKTHQLFLGGLTIKQLRDEARP